MHRQEMLQMGEYCFCSLLINISNRMLTINKLLHGDKKWIVKTAGRCPGRSASVEQDTKNHTGNPWMDPPFTQIWPLSVESAWCISLFKFEKFYRRSCKTWSICLILSHDLGRSELCTCTMYMYVYSILCFHGLKNRLTF